MRTGGAPIDTLTVPSAACISAVMHVACCMPHGCMFLATCTWHLWQVVSVPPTVLRGWLQNATQVQSDTAVLVPGLVGSKVRENSIDSSTHSAAVASQNRHAAVCAACIATDSLCAHNRTAPHRTALHCTALHRTALHRRLSRSRRFINTARRSHSSPLALPMAATRAESCASRRQPRHCACTALHCSLSSPQCKLTSACCGSYTWGWNAEAQLGHSDGKAAVYVPTPVAFRRSSDSEAL